MPPFFLKLSCMMYKLLKINIFLVSRWTTLNYSIAQVWHFSSFTCKSSSIISYILLLLWFDRALRTSIFAMNNISKRKHGASKLGFLSYDYGFIFCKYTEAVVHICSTKLLFLKISQNSKENTDIRYTFLISNRFTRAYTKIRTQQPGPGTPRPRSPGSMRSSTYVFIKIFRFLTLIFQIF